MKYDALGWRPGMKRPRVLIHDGGYRVVWPRGDVLWARTREQAAELVEQWKNVVLRGRDKG